MKSVAGRLGVNYHTLRQWVVEAKMAAADSTVPADLPPEQQLRELQKENALPLTVEFENTIHQFTVLNAKKHSALGPELCWSWLRATSTVWPAVRLMSEASHCFKRCTIEISRASRMQLRLVHSELDIRPRSPAADEKAETTNGVLHGPRGRPCETAE